MVTKWIWIIISLFFCTNSLKIRASSDHHRYFCVQCRNELYIN